jgi:hypothetical protein
MDKEEEKFNFLYWGPLVTKFNLEDSFCKELLARGKKCKKDARRLLAGILDKELEYEQEDVDWFCKKFSPYLNSHMNFLNHYHNRKFEVSLDLDRLWINFMKHGESNPLHQHSGDISFVIFLEVPEELKNEKKKYIGTDSSGPGGLIFMNGLGKDELNVDRHAVFPEEGMCFIFPASLNHMVTPFKTKKERISVSGNFNFIEKHKLFDDGRDESNTFLRNRPKLYES